MTSAIMERYRVLANADRQVFNAIFRKTWESCYSAQDLKKEESIVGFEELKDALIVNQNQEKEEGLGLKAALSEMFIQNVTKIIEKLKEKVESDKINTD